MDFEIKKFENEHLNFLDQLIEDEYELGRIRWFCENSPQTSYLGFLGEELVGVTSYSGSVNLTDLVIYISPNHRNSGYGNILYNFVESKIKESEIRKLELVYVNDPENKYFLSKKGFDIEFSSTYMTYSGGKVDDCKYKIIQYEDKHYLETRTVIREAYHKMQVAVGIEEENFEYPPNEAQRKLYLEDAENRYLMLLENEIIASITLDDEEIDDLVVSVKHQGKGYGRELMAFAINKLIDDGYDQLELWCIVGNPAEQFYSKIGFEEQMIHDISYKRLVR